MVKKKAKKTVKKREPIETPEVTEKYVVRAVRLGAGYRDDLCRMYIPQNVAHRLGIVHGSLLEIRLRGDEFVVKKIIEPQQT
ncbi:MAG: hypothetical protein QXH97_00330 [Candidatus Bathyarchaeia archaeon]